MGNTELNVPSLDVKISSQFRIKTPEFSLRDGDFLRISGPNGSGKSTFVRWLAHLSPYSTEKMKLKVNGAEIPAGQWRRQMTYLPESFSLPPRETLSDSLCYFMTLRGLPRSEARTRLTRYCEEWNLTSLLAREANQLSVGLIQQMKVALVMAQQSPIALLDEPLRSVDEEGRRSLSKQLAERLSKGAVIISAFLPFESTAPLQPHYHLIFENGQATMKKGKES